MNLLDSHDVPRALHTLLGDIAALKLALLMLFLHPGAPCIYYGSEAGLAGGPDGDHATGPGPGCREAFPWGPFMDSESQPMDCRTDATPSSLSVIEAGAAQWTAIGNDGLSADFGDLQVLINRSPTQVGYESRTCCGVEIDENSGRELSTQSACVLEQS